MTRERLACIHSSADDLQNQALLALSTLAGEQSSTGGGLEHLTHAVVGLGRAFEILVGTDLLADFLTLILCQRIVLAHSRDD